MSEDLKPKKSAPLIDLSLMSERERAIYDALSKEEKPIYLGLGPGSRKDFDVPEFNKLPWEQVYDKGNAFITLGLDRPGDETTGFGANAATHCGAIDLVAGRKGWLARKRRKRSGTIRIVDNDPVLDAARVYICQKSDPDGYFGIKPGKVGNTSLESPRSTIVAKADTLRFVARENIKFVTKTDLRNSQGAVLSDLDKRIFGIDLMAMNGAGGQQPLVKGQNLVVLLTVLTKAIQQIASITNTYIVQTREIHKAVLKHKHFAPLFGKATAPDFENVIPTTINSMIDNVTNVDVGINDTQMAFNQIVLEYLTLPGGSEFVDPKRTGSNYILSAYNTTN